MTTSGTFWLAQALVHSYPSNSGFQYGSSVLPRSIAAPMAGMWLVVSPAVMRAMSVTVLNGAPALRRTASGDHHLLIVLDGHPRHRAHRLEVAEPVGGEDLGQEVDVPAQVEHLVVVAVEHGLLLVFGHRPLIEVGTFAGLEPLPVLRLHQAHAELVQLIALFRARGGEH